MNVVRLISKYYLNNSVAYNYLVQHSKAVADLALAVGKQNPQLLLDLQFIFNSAMIHDIGVLFCNAPGIGCFGSELYIRHGVLGAELLRKEGFPLYANVCERHVGIGISAKEIEENNLPLPIYDMLPLSHEEKIVCVADKFFSKSKQYLTQSKSYDLIYSEMGRLGNRQQNQFKEYFDFYGFENVLNTFDF